MQAVEFLQRFHPTGYWVLTAITPDKTGPTTKTFSPDQSDNARAWIDGHVGHANLYFMVNQPAGPLTKKATKADVATAGWLHVDIDARAGEPLPREFARIQASLDAFTPRPSAVVFSGGGYQAFWRLKQPLKVTVPEELERYNQQLAYVLEGDCCHNIDRIMRLPATINIPTAKKVERGRTPVESNVCWFEDSAYELSEFTPAGSMATVRVGKPEQIEDLNHLDRWNVPGRIKVIIAQGANPDEINDGDTSRSAWLFDAVCNLVRCGVPDEIVLGIITDETWEISASVLDKSKPEEYALRQIQRAHDVAVDYRRRKNGDIINCLWNVRLALRKLGREITHDTFADHVRVDGQIMDDNLLTRLWGDSETETGWTPPWDSFNRYVRYIAQETPVHPVRDYLASLTWDGVERIDRWLVVYAGAVDGDYVRAVGRLVLVAAVRRVRDPGCKFDEMLVLESPQGMHKSSALSCLAVNDEWFTDDLPLGDDTKRQMESISGKWIVEAGELAGMHRADVDSLKTFLSRQVDVARMAYARENTRAPRQCIIIGSTNNDQYLKDSTGNRRFWPVAVNKFDLTALKRDRDQLWAEAARVEAGGASIRLSPELYPHAGTEQDKRYEKHEYHGLLEIMLLGIEHGHVASDDVRIALGISNGHCTPQQNTNMGRAMKALGWERYLTKINTRQCYAYRRGDGWPRLEYRDGELVAAEDEREVPF